MLRVACTRVFRRCSMFFNFARVGEGTSRLAEYYLGADIRMGTTEDVLAGKF